MSFYFIIAVLISLLVYGIFVYNRLVKQKQLVNEAWSGIDVQLKRRHDLIPNLIDIVKGYAGHEVETLAKIVTERQQQQVNKPNNSDIKEISSAEKQIGGNTKEIFALAEAYPAFRHA